MELHVASSTSRTVEIKWTVLFDGNSPVLHHSISYNSSYGNVTFQTDSGHQRYNVSGLKPATFYAFWVTATNELGTSRPATVYHTSLEAGEGHALKRLLSITVPVFLRCFNFFSFSSYVSKHALETKPK